MLHCQLVCMVVCVHGGVEKLAVAWHSRRYEKYDAEVNTDKVRSDDPFMEEYQEVEAEVEKLLEVRGRRDHAAWLHAYNNPHHHPCLCRTFCTTPLCSHAATQLRCASHPSREH